MSLKSSTMTRRKCRKCTDQFGQSPLLKGHRCPWKLRPSGAQLKHTSRETPRPSKRNASGLIPVPPLSLEMQTKPAFVPLFVSPTFINPVVSSFSTPSYDGRESASNTNSSFDMDEDHLYLFNCCSAEISEGPANCWLPLEDLSHSLNVNARNSEDVMGDHLGDELDAGGACMTPEASTSANVNSALGSSDAEDGPQHHSFDLDVVDCAGDDDPTVQFCRDTVEGAQALTEKKQPNKKRRRSVVYLTDDRGRTKAHSERTRRVLRAVGNLDTVSRPLIFLYIARPESILSKQGKSVVYTSAALQEAFDAKEDSCPIANIQETARSYIHKKMLSSNNAVATSVTAEVDRLQAELLAEQQRRQAAEAQLASFTQQ